MLIRWYALLGEVSADIEVKKGGLLIISWLETWVRTSMRLVRVLLRSKSCNRYIV